MTTNKGVKLPESDTIRWVVSRKIAIVRAVESGQITMIDVIKKYKNISFEELESWIKMYKTLGRLSLRSTRLQDYRNKKQ